jgi:hypothetical protein
VIAILLPGIAQATPTPMTALINGDSVTTGDGITDGSGNPISLEQFAARHLGYTVTVVTGAQWDAMTQSDFAKYRVLINGDPMCSDPVTSTTSNASTWTPVVMGTAGGNTQPGNRALNGTDPEYHYLYGGGGGAPTNPSDPTTAGAEHLVEAGIKFAGDGPAATTGLYFSTGCGEESSPGWNVSTLDMLTTMGPGNWSEDTSPPCGGSVQQIATVSEFFGVSDGDIQGWGCSDHTTWPGFPADWNAEAVATDTATQPTCGTDPSTGTTACGEAYVLLAGSGVTATAPDISLSPASATNPVGGSHTVTAKVTQSGSPVPGATVTFAIGSGPNAGATGTCMRSDNSADPGCTTGSDGEVLFAYNDTGGAGTDSIDASVTLSGSTEHATATKTWVAGGGDQPISGSGTDVSATEGAAFTGKQVATFTDPDTSSAASEYSASIDWGDGHTSTGTVTGSAGSFTVTGDYTYAEHGSYTVHVTITDVDNTDNSVTTNSTAQIAEQPLSVTGAAVSATEGQSFSGTVATFTDGDTAPGASEYSASIDWGDGHTSTGTVTGSAGSFTVTGGHTYAEKGSYTVHVTVQETDNAATGTSSDATATVGDAALTAAGKGTLTSGAAFSGDVATFTDANTSAPLSDFSATINWGDGHTGTGAVSGSAGSYGVSGRHTYGGSGSFTVTVTIDDVDGSHATATTTIDVSVATNTPPGCSAVIATPDMLWPPNHKFRLVTLSGATDPDGDSLTYTITSVTQDEPVFGHGDTGPDAKSGPTSDSRRSRPTGSRRVYLRAERRGNGTGRLYFIAFTVTDGHRHICERSVTVTVPHDRRHHHHVPTRDTGKRFDSFSKPPRHHHNHH